jgi:hypothetical protein
MAGVSLVIGQHFLERSPLVTTMTKQVVAGLEQIASHGLSHVSKNNKAKTFLYFFHYWQISFLILLLLIVVLTQNVLDKGEARHLDPFLVVI